jgi:hypothetical protein
LASRHRGDTIASGRRPGSPGLPVGSRDWSADPTAMHAVLGGEVAMVVPIHQVPSWKFTAGHPKPLIAIVHHRMVGTLPGTDRTFTKGKRVASTHFGVGLCSKHGGKGVTCIHQYVLLGNQAWGNGNNRYPEGHPKAGQLVPSTWNERYPTTLVNSRTISIEHHDNGIKGHPKSGVVPEAVIEASIGLDELLLSGDVAAMKAAGIRFRAGSAATIGLELKAIRPGRHTIIDHNYIAGPLKPRCWKPWRKDAVGFPQARYLAELAGPIDVDNAAVVKPPTHSEGEVVKSFATPTVPTLAKVRTDAWLYDNSALEPSAKNIQIDPGREMPLLGVIGTKARIVSYVNAAGKTVGRAYWVEAGDIESTRPA